MAAAWPEPSAAGDWVSPVAFVTGCVLAAVVFVVAVLLLASFAATAADPGDDRD